MDELKVRRAQLATALEAARARAKELQAQHADAARLGEREAQLEAFAAAVREGLDALDFEGRQRLVRLLIERVVVTGERVTIEHAVPLSGRFCRLRKNDVGRVRLREVWRPGQASTPWGCAASPPAWRTARAAPVSGPPRPRRSCSHPRHGLYPAYTPEPVNDFETRVLSQNY